MKTRIAYDLDGVIAPKRQHFLLDVLWFLHPRLASFIAHYHLPEPLRIPEPNALIITGRPGKEYDETLRWLHQYRIRNELIMNPIRLNPDREKSLQWKVDNINERKITHYYEDDPLVVKALRKLTKSKIIYVR